MARPWPHYNGPYNTRVESIECVWVKDWFHVGSNLVFKTVVLITLV